MSHWLIKSEPDAYCLADLKKEPRKTAHWDGIRNYQARNFMRDDMAVGDLVLDDARHEVRRGEHVVELTPTEYEILRLLMRNAGVVLDRPTMYEEIWGYTSETSSKSWARPRRTSKAGLRSTTSGDVMPRAKSARSPDAYGRPKRLRARPCRRIRNARRFSIRS